MLNLLTLDVQLASRKIKLTAVRKRFVSFVNSLKKAAKHAHDSAVASKASSATGGNSTGSQGKAAKNAQTSIVTLKPKRVFTEEEMWHKDRIKDFSNAMIHLVDGEDMIWYDETLVTDDYVYNARFTEMYSWPNVSTKPEIKNRVKSSHKDDKALSMALAKGLPLLTVPDSDIELNVLSLDMGPNSCLDVSTLAEAPVFMSAVQYEEDLAQSGETVDSTFSGDDFLDVDVLDRRLTHDNEHPSTERKIEELSDIDFTQRIDDQLPEGTFEDVNLKIKRRGDEDLAFFEDTSSDILFDSFEKRTDLSVVDVVSADTALLCVSVPLAEKASKAEIKLVRPRETTLPKRKRSKLKRRSKKQKKHRR